MKPAKLAICDRAMAALADGVRTTAEVAAMIGEVSGGPRSPIRADVGPSRPAHAGDVYPLLAQLERAGQVARVHVPGSRAVAWRRIVPLEPLPEWAEDGIP